jgi:Calcineurin-like phosphoesterase
LRIGLVALGMALLHVSACSEEPPASGLQVPEIDEAAMRWIATRIYRNEARGQARYLTHWGTGEDFPSLGIGHFIWFPAGVDAPFDESFPALFEYLVANGSPCADAPGWLRELDPFAATWQSQADFIAAQDSEQMLALRQWLAATAPQQARFIVARFEERWAALGEADGELTRLTALLQRLMSTPEGLFAVIDYSNFKGLGTNPRERYADRGWGLLQVLQDIDTSAPADASPADLVERFSSAAANRLRDRVAAAPAERNEARWLPGWLRRVDDYRQAVDAAAQQAYAGFRVTPYLQQPAAAEMKVVWFSDVAAAGELSLRRGEEVLHAGQSVPVPACDLNYHPLELADLADGRLPAAPYRHEIVLRDLEPGVRYRYEVTQNGHRASGDVRLPAGRDTPINFVVYADSETEPESIGKPAAWGGMDDAATDMLYLVDQDTGYRENLLAIAAAAPDFVAIAGDLVQSGGEQRDWDEFWRLNAPLAASTPIFPARGNHDYFAGPGAFGGYGNEATRRAIKKFQAYFALPGNGADNAYHRGAWYSLEQGPVTLIVIDSNDGEPHRTDADTNWYLHAAADGGIAPAWNPGSEQYRWLEKALQTAQQRSRFTFVMLHAPPYSSGVHGLPPGFGDGEDYLSGRPLRALTPLFLRYGVDAVFSGHDELYEHAVVAGTEQRPDGTEREHNVNFIIVGIGGDGLRGPLPQLKYPERVFSAHEDAPKVFADDGTLQGGGMHYGHLQVSVSADGEQGWQARIEPFYIVPLMNPDGSVREFSKQRYEDVTVIHEPAGAAK